MELSGLLNRCELSTFIAIDLETTGLDPRQESIIEISAVKFINGKQDSVFSHLINPNKPISSFIEDLTGINDSMVKGKPVFEDILDDFIDFIGNYPIVGHNVKFDIGFIREHSKNKLDLVPRVRMHNFLVWFYLLKSMMQLIYFLLHQQIFWET